MKHHAHGRVHYPDVTYTSKKQAKTLKDELSDLYMVDRYRPRTGYPIKNGERGTKVKENFNRLFRVG